MAKVSVCQWDLKESKIRVNISTIQILYRQEIRVDEEGVETREGDKTREEERDWEKKTEKIKKGMEIMEYEGDKSLRVG